MKHHFWIPDNVIDLRFELRKVYPDDRRISWMKKKQLIAYFCKVRERQYATLEGRK